MERDYGAATRRWRPMVDISARLLGTPRLPNPGRPISHLYLSHVAVDDDRTDVFAALMARAYNDAVRRLKGETVPMTISQPSPTKLWISTAALKPNSV